MVIKLIKKRHGQLNHCQVVCSYGMGFKPFTCHGCGDDLEEDGPAEADHDLLPLQLHGHVQDGEQREEGQTHDRHDGTDAGYQEPCCKETKDSVRGQTAFNDTTSIRPLTTDLPDNSSPMHAYICTTRPLYT